MFTVYSKPACSFCDSAKALLDLKSKTYKVINLDVNQLKLADQVYITRAEFLSKFPNQRTLPLIIHAEQQVGGFAELKKYLE